MKTQGIKAVIKAFRSADPAHAERLEAVAFVMPRGGVAKHSAAFAVFGLLGAKVWGRFTKAREERQRVGTAPGEAPLPGRLVLALSDQLELVEVDMRARPVGLHAKFDRGTYAIRDVHNSLKVVRFTLVTPDDRTFALEAPRWFSERPNAGALKTIAAAGRT